MPARAREAAPAVIAREQPEPAGQIDALRRGAVRRRARRRGAVRRGGRGPPAVVEAEDAARRRADRAGTIRPEGQREDRTDDQPVGLARPAAAAAFGAHQAEIGAEQQPGRVARIDRDRERRVEKQPGIGVEPGGAEIAGTEQAAIGARVVR